MLEGRIGIAVGGTEMRTRMKFVYIIEKADDGSYSAFVPDLPGCTSCADTVDEIRRSIKDAVDSYLDSLREHNEPIPTPSSVIDTVEAA
jgi:predicted RNase H-like HicB family nuclease